MKAIFKEILDLLLEDCRISNAEIAARLSIPEKEAAAAVAKLTSDNIIKGYTVVVNDAALESDRVMALIEVKVTPTREGGFDAVARRIAKFPEVVDLSLVSGSFDLLLSVEGKSLQEVAGFVSAKLSTIEGVLSTSTSFLLKRYKRSGKIMEDDEEYERLKICP